MTTLQITTTTDACSLRKILLEIMEMIFGLLNFPDLRAVIRVSKWIKVLHQSQCVQVVPCSLFSHFKILASNRCTWTLSSCMMSWIFNRDISIQRLIGLYTLFYTLSPINSATRSPSAPSNSLLTYLVLGSSDVVFYDSIIHPRNCVILVPKISSIPIYRWRRQRNITVSW